MSDLPDSVPTSKAPTTPRSGEAELDVDVAAFLPEPEPEPESVPESARESGSGSGSAPGSSSVDAAQLSWDLDRVDATLAALDAKTYGSDPETGELIGDQMLAEDPTRLS